MPGAPDDYAALIAATGPGTLADVLRLLVPGAGADEERHRTPDIPDEARLWGVFATGETCWWLPICPDPADWLIVRCPSGRFRPGSGGLDEDVEKYGDILNNHLR